MISVAASEMRATLAPLAPTIVQQVADHLPELLHQLISRLQQTKPPIPRVLSSDPAAREPRRGLALMTEKEREVIRRLHHQWVEETRQQSQMIKDLQIATQALTNATISLAKRQLAQEQMLKLIEDLLELQHD